MAVDRAVRGVGWDLHPVRHLPLRWIPLDAVDLAQSRRPGAVRVLADCADQGEPGTVVQDSNRGRPGDELRRRSAVGIFWGGEGTLAPRRASSPGTPPLPPSLFAQSLLNTALR